MPKKLSKVSRFFSKLASALWQIRNAIAVVTGCALFGIVLSWWQSSSNQYFPALPSGGYTGQLKGVFDPSTPEATVYLESIGKRNTLMLVVFKDGWKPRFLKLSSLPIKDGQLPRNQPLVLTIEDKTFALSGSPNETGYSGEIKSEGKTVGSWWLKPTSNTELRQDQIQLADSFQFSKWLRSKAHYRQGIETLEKLSKAAEREKERKQAVVRLGQNDPQLISAGSSFRDELKLEVENLKNTFGEQQKQVQELKEELEQLQRITRVGRTVDLSKRLAKRENRWYLVNWQQDEEIAGMEESLASSMNLDIEKLNQSYERLQEIRRLRARIIQERAQVAELNRIYQEKLNPQKGAPEKGREDAPGKDGEERPWWRKWDSIFG